jgi:uncharacterized protein YhbP (UPF0306 family)
MVTQPYFNKINATTNYFYYTTSAFYFFNAKKKTFYYSNKRFNTVCAEISRFAASGITND